MKYYVCVRTILAEASENAYSISTTKGMAHLSEAAAPWRRNYREPTMGRDVPHYRRRHAACTLIYNRRAVGFKYQHGKAQGHHPGSHVGTFVSVRITGLHRRRGVTENEPKRYA